MSAADSKVRRKKYLVTYCQTVLQDCLHVLDMINSTYTWQIYPDSIWFQFFCLTFSFASIHCFDGWVKITFKKIGYPYGIKLEMRCVEVRLFKSFYLHEISLKFGQFILLHVRRALKNRKVLPTKLHNKLSGIKFEIWYQFTNEKLLLLLYKSTYLHLTLPFSFILPALSSIIFWKRNKAFRFVMFYFHSEVHPKWMWRKAMRKKSLILVVAMSKPSTFS